MSRILLANSGKRAKYLLSRNQNIAPVWTHSTQWYSSTRQALEEGGEANDGATETNEEEN